MTKLKRWLVENYLFESPVNEVLICILCGVLCYYAI